MKKFDIIIACDECKGCERCIKACPKNLLLPSKNFNIMGYISTEYLGSGCIGCGNCYYACPEPGAITIIEEENEQ